MDYSNLEPQLAEALQRIADVMESSATAGPNTSAIVAATLACGIIVLGSAAGIAFIGGKALDAQARQPEVGQRAFSTMVIAAALVEGVTFFALLVCFLALYWLH